MTDIEKDFVHLARLALEGKQESVATIVRKTLNTLASRRLDLSDQIQKVFSLATTPPIRETPNTPIPIDLDSRLELLRREQHPCIQTEPSWPENVKNELNAVLLERTHATDLYSRGLSPTRSVLFVGPPGVGKTLAARWLARELNLPLLILDLAAVMSSFLGRTGNNVRVVLDYARHSSSILLLDEFDAIAKRRDDTGEVGELKRLVTVLLQAIDDWPSGSLLLAATNHPELLDPAVWRRFERTVKFPLPKHEDLVETLKQLLLKDSQETLIDFDLLANIFEGYSFSDVTRAINQAQRQSIVTKTPLDLALLSMATQRIQELPQSVKLAFARNLEKSKSQREISSITGLSRDTLRKHLQTSNKTNKRKTDGART